MPEARHSLLILTLMLALQACQTPPPIRTLPRQPVVRTIPVDPATVKTLPAKKAPARGEVLPPVEPPVLPTAKAPPPIPVAPYPDVNLADHYPRPRGANRVGSGYLEMIAINTGERKRIKLYDKKGRLRSVALKQLSQVCRDHRKKRRRTMDPRLAAILYLTAQTFDRPIQLVSGYRVERRKKRKKRKKRGKRRRYGSRHGSGEAVDIRLPGVPPADLAYWVRANFEKVGVGHYPTSEFVHIDVRDSSYYWIDYSGPGEAQRLKAVPVQPKPRRGSDWTTRKKRLPQSLRP